MARGSRPSHRRCTRQREEAADAVPVRVESGLSQLQRAVLAQPALATGVAGVGVIVSYPMPQNAKHARRVSTCDTFGAGTEVEGDAPGAILG